MIFFYELYLSCEVYKERTQKEHRKIIEKAIIDLYNELHLKRNMIVRIKRTEGKNQSTIYCGTHEMNEDWDHEIEINTLMFFMVTPISMFRTLCHEMYHAFQTEHFMTISEKNAEKVGRRLFKKFYPSFRNSMKEVWF